MRAESQRGSPRHVLEVATLIVRPGAQAAFEAAFEKAERLLVGLRGYLSHELQQSVGHEQHYALMIEWRSVEDGSHGRQGSLEYERWRLLLQDHLAERPSVEYFQPVAGARRALSNSCD